MQETERQRDRETDKDKGRQTKGDKQRQTDRETERRDTRDTAMQSLNSDSVAPCLSTSGSVQVAATAGALTCPARAASNGKRVYDILLYQHLITNTATSITKFSTRTSE